MISVFKSNIQLGSKFILTLVALFFAFGLLQSQTRPSVYQKAYKSVGKNTYTKTLLVLSKEKIDENWNDYQGGNMNTEDSLFYFNSNLLYFSFPTNSAIYKNTYLLYYFSQKTAKCPTLFSLLNHYNPVIEQNLGENNLPNELKLLPAVLSGFNPYSNNTIGGSGFWHLNYPQAVKYGLNINELVDERKDFEKSTKAATRYLKDLYTKYNDWELALTAYSSGVVTVEKLLQRHQAKTYKEIYPFLPEQTKDLVQAFVAMNYIYNYDSYGAIDLNPIIEVDTIVTDRKLKFEALHHVLATTTDDINFYNPTLNSNTFPANFTVYVPKGKGEEYKQYKDSIYFYQDSVMLKPKTEEPEFLIPKEGEPYLYKVKSGDVLGLIADRHNVKVSQIQAWNNLKGTMINVGQELTIYGKSEKVKNNAPVKTENTQKTNENKPKQEVKPTKNTTTGKVPVLTVYTVKSGDNLWVIAKKYPGVSAQNIMDFNGIDGNLKVGQKINIPKY